MARKLKVGDIVRLRSEVGPEMTVETLPTDAFGGLVGCVWFDSDGSNHWTGPHRASFPPLCLVHSEST